MLQWLYIYVSSLGSKCFICFRRMVQVLHLDVTKVDLDIAYICKYFKYFHTYVISVFICMFAMATHVVSSFLWCFASVSDVCCKCFNCFGRMLQMFSLDVAKVDMVLHMLWWDLSAIAACCNCWMLMGNERQA